MYKKAFWENKHDNGNKWLGQEILHPTILQKMGNKVTEPLTINKLIQVNN